MESFEMFMDIFERCKTQRNGADLAGILKDSRKYFQNLSTSDSGLILSMLFDERRGLLRFLNDELDRHVASRGFNVSIYEGYRLLEFVIDQFCNLLAPYIFDIKKTCQLALTEKCSYYIKKSASAAFKKLIINTCSSFELELDKTVQEFIQKFCIVSIKERSIFFVVLGVIAKYCPEVIAEHSYDIFKQLKNDFVLQYKHGESSQPTELQIYLEVLTDMLDNFSPSTQSSEYCNKYYEALYSYIKDLSVYREQHRKVIMRAAISLLQRHMRLFSEFVYNDYKFWHELLCNFLQPGGGKEDNRYTLKVYYKMIGKMLRDRDSEEDRAKFLYFKEFFTKSITSDNLESNALRLVIYGLSQMAGSYKRYLTEDDIGEMYSLIARRTISLYIREDEEYARFEDISDYQEALSEITCHMSNISANQISALTKLCILLIKRFPNLSASSQTSAVASLMRTVINMGSVSRSIHQKFIHNLIYEGVIWTCSHTLFIDAELERGLRNLEERPICYKNYLPLWQQLLDPSRFRLQGRVQVTQQLFDEMISTCIVLIDKLNLNVESKEDNVFSDIGLSQTAVNETDFRIFVNLVDLYVDIFEKLEPSLLDNWLHRFLYEIIRNSYRYPLISGFYKLVYSVLKMDIIHDSQKFELIGGETHALMSHYISGTIDLVCTFSDELQITCLNLILTTPMSIAENIVERAAPIFIIAFTVGLSNFALACSALDALEKWTRGLGSACTNEFLCKVVPSLEPYLRSRESTVELLQDILRTERKVIKKVTFMDREKTLEDFQRRILLFLGSLDSDVMLNLVYKRSLDTGASWDKKDLLKYTIPYADLKLDIYFDRILPRIIELALNSGDRRTKVVACEVLQSIVAMMLGKTVQLLSSDPDRFACLYKTLCPTLLKLGCDSDEVVRQLFHPLMLQLTHWLSSKLMLQSPKTIILVETLFGGLSDESNSSLRDFSGICLAEFVSWSMKQSTDADLARSPINIRVIVRKITYFALHPSASKRVAAAIAFNHLYRILRESKEIVNIFWLEFLYCFVKSLDGCNDPRIESALNHVEKVVQMKSDIFNKHNSRRRKPMEFEDSTLISAADWLFLQCGSLDRKCRRKCMDLLKNVSPFVKNCDSIQSMISVHLKSRGIQNLNCVILKSLDVKMGVLSFDSMNPLLRTLDCYVWLIRDELIDLDLLFTDLNVSKDEIFNCVQNFVHLLMSVKVEGKENATVSFKESERLIALRCEVIVTLFNFIQTLFNATNDQAVYVPKFFWSKELFALVSTCALNPQAVGFSMKNLEITESLPVQMEGLLNVLTSKLDDCFVRALKVALAAEVEKKYKHFFNLDDIINNKMDVELKQYVNGLVLLRKCELLNQLCKNEYDVKYIQDKVTDIFDALKKEQFGKLICTTLKLDTREYLESLMDLLLMNYEPSVTKTLWNLVGNDTVLLNQDSMKIRHGEYFLNQLKNPIFRNALKNIEETMTVLLDNFIPSNCNVALTIVEELVTFALRHKRELQDYLEFVADAIVRRCSNLERAVSNCECGKEKFTNIYTIVVRLKNNPIDISKERGDLYLWILKELTRNSDIARKAQILRGFLICLTSPEYDNDPQLTIILNSLKGNSTLSLRDLPKNSAERLKITEYFQTLLTLLPVTKSVSLFECVVNFAAGVGKYLCDEKTTEYLHTYFNSISDSGALKSLEVAHGIFMNSDDLENRFDALQRFLLPAFEFCNATTIEQFYERNIKEIYTIVAQSLTGSDLEVKRLTVSKIGCYNLIEIMFARVQGIDSTDSKITRNAISNVKTGKELLQELYNNALRIRVHKTGDPENKEIMRLLHCAAYNCSIAIVSLKSEERLYLTVFGENRKKGQLIWENIVDCDKLYELRQTFNELPKERKKLINIRQNAREGQNADERFTYVQSYNRASLTLNEDIRDYDLNDITLSCQSADSSTRDTMYLTFECDDLNEHECMAAICGVLTHMISNEISLLPKESDAPSMMPQWLRCFHNSMSTTKHDNVRLFMLKIVLNVRTVFKPYAKFFLAPLISAVNLYLTKHQLNYVITDVLIMLIDWHTVAVPNQSEDNGTLARKLLKLLIDRVDDARRNVFKYNVNIIRTLIQVWHECLAIPESLDEKMKTSPSYAVQLILIFLANDMQRHLVNRHDILEYLLKSVANWQANEEMILQICESLGLILKFTETASDFEDKKRTIVDGLRAVFRQIQSRHENTLIKCVHAVCKRYPNVAEDYFDLVTSCILRVDQSSRSKCLEVFLLLVPKFNVERIVKELGYIKFHDTLKNKVLPCERIGLQIIHKLAPILGSSDFLSLFNLVPPYAKHNYLEYREIAYDIFMSVYNKYCDDISDDDNVKVLMGTSKEILLTGLLDPAEDLQRKLLKFWTEGRRLTENCSERLLEVLNIYSPNVEDVYLPIVPLTMLHLISKSPDFERKMFEPLHNCKFKDYSITVYWRSKNLGSQAPLFAPSLASQMNRTFTQSSQSLQNWSYNPLSAAVSRDEDADIRLMLRTTQTLEFERTVQDELLQSTSRVSAENLSYEKISRASKVPQPTDNRTSRRFLANSSDVSDTMRHVEMKKNIRRDEMLKEEVTRQRSSVKIYRKYRIGDFPDVEITHSSIIVPLQELVKKDQLICKDLTVSIFHSLINVISSSPDKSGEFLERTVQSLTFILANCRGDNSIVATVLEIMLNTRVIDLCPDTVAKVSKSSGLLSLGALLLENRLICGVFSGEVSEPPAKRLRGQVEEVDPDSNQWIQLASLYESMSEVDVVLSIFSSKVSGQALQEASRARAANEWERARNAYKVAYESEASSIKEHCLEGLYECLSRLSCWDAIDSSLTLQIGDNLNVIWDRTWKRDWIISWIFRTHVRLMLDEKPSEKFVEALNNWVANKDTLHRIKGPFGEEVATFFITADNQEAARDFLMRGLEEIRQQWIHLNPLCANLRACKLSKLRGTSDIDVYLKTLKARDLSHGVQYLLKYWTSSVPSSQDDLLLWDNFITCRLYFASLLKEKLQTVETEQNDGIPNDLSTISFRQRLNLIESALSQKNRQVARKHLVIAEQEVENCSLNLKNQWLLMIAKFKYLCGEIAKDDETKLTRFLSSWEYTQSLMQKDSIESKVRVVIGQHASTLANTLAVLAAKSERIADTLVQSNAVTRIVTDQPVTRDNVVETLNVYSLLNLKECCDMAGNKDVGACYLKLSNYCYDRILAAAIDVQLSREFVRSTLKAMSYGSLEAAHYFPCLLKPEHLESDQVKQTFVSESERVQTWLYLTWQAQLLSHIGTGIAPVIAPIVERIAETYPNAMIYIFRVTVETNPELTNDSKIYKIKQILFDKTKVETLLAAMQYLVQPELYLLHYLNNLSKNLSQGIATVVDSLLKKVYPAATRKTLGAPGAPAQGAIYRVIADYRVKVEKIRSKSYRDVGTYVNTLKKDLRDTLSKRSDKTRLKDYSPWLCEYAGGDVEIPGQYLGNRKPIPRYHVKIMKFEPAVRVMQSLRKPIRITMVGNDAKNYKFLVKFGEDLRLDQRIEQLFTIMNKSLHIDATCRQRQLSIDTYQVIPLTSTLGLIQWIDDTRPLQDFIYFTLDEKQQHQYKSVRLEYVRWIQEVAPRKNMPEQYKEALSRYNAQQVIAKLNRLTAKTEWDSLRNTFKMLSPSPESFMALRHNFVTTYATMCVAHWILGIGDRHLENTLIATNSGRSLGIDFGLAFGGGIDQDVPELMPFRLTSQILGLLRPFDENGLLGSTMTHVLRALRNGKGPLIACMEVFVHEPLNWMEHVNKRSMENQGEYADIKWLPKKKISTAVQKLNGVKPSLITLEQLKDRHADKYFSRYTLIVNGSDEHNKRIRATMKDEHLTPEEQVQCLLDQATDLNILGRTFAGWCPWL